MKTAEKRDWVSKLADRVIQAALSDGISQSQTLFAKEAKTGTANEAGCTTQEPGLTNGATAGQTAGREASRAPASALGTIGKKIVVASGISPSGQIHLGNLREVLTGHFVADEIASRGFECEHILSWDDFDRLRKIPANVDRSYEQYIGMPLSDVPAPRGSAQRSWAEHFREDFEAALETLGINIRPIYQSQMYRSGVYSDNVLVALEKRHEIRKIISEYQTQKSAQDEDYYPYVIYCTKCGKDLTRIQELRGNRLSYCCKCGHYESVDLRTFHNGKLPWKVDWPMRWLYESVDFEPGGVDHCAPGSASLGASSDIAQCVFGRGAPLTVMYAFVGVEGHAKMSSSAGTVLTPRDALLVMESPLLRWMYVRRKPNQSFTVGFDQSLQRLYDEWDSLAGGLETCDGDMAASYARAVSTTSVRLRVPEIPISFRTLVSLVDISAGDDMQLLRMLQNLHVCAKDLEQFEPRLSRARQYSRQFSNPVRVLKAPNTQVLQALTPELKNMLRAFVRGLDENWSFDKLGAWAYGVPKAALGIDQEVKSVDQEVKTLQKAFFKTIYQLIIGQDKGPRLPTLLMAVGKQNVVELLRVD